MAKGKKKGKKEGEGDPPTVSGLSISEDTPSTSQAPEEEEAVLGLTGKSRKTNRKQKQAEAKAASAAATLAQPAKKPEQPSTSQAKVKEDHEPEEKPEQQAEQKPEQELEKKPEKKPEQGPERALEQATEQMLVTKTEPKPEAAKEEPKEDVSGGLGLGLGGGKKRRPKKKSLATVEAEAKATKEAPAVEQGSAGPLPGLGSQPGPLASSASAGPWQGGWSAAPTGPTPALPVQTQAVGGKVVPGVQTSKLQVIAQAPSTSKEVVPTATRLELSCRYKIPAKVQGRSVRHTPTKVLTNYLPITFKPIKVYRYDVTLKPDRPKKMLGTAFKMAKEKLYKNELIAFDQAKNCYSLNPLKDVPANGSGRSCVQVEIVDPNGKVMPFEVSFKATGVVDFMKIKQHMESGGSTLSTPSEEIQCIDVILRQGALEAYVKSGRQFFKRPQNPINLTGGLEMWTGLFQSAIFTSRAFINIDVAHKGFPIQQSLIDALTKSFRLDTSSLVERQRRGESEQFIAFMKNLRIVATMVGQPNKGQKREFTCNGLLDSPDKVSFTCEREGKKVSMTVADYFKLEKGYKIKYPNLNCVWVGPRDRFIYYPMELLDVAYGQVLNKQLNEFQLANMVKEAATPPSDRKRKIEEVAQCMNYSSNVFFKKFGLEISNKFLEVEAKILTPPSLDTGERMVTVPKRGSWMANRLLKPEPLPSWGFIAIECNPVASNYEEIKVSLMNIGRQLGMEVAEPKMKLFNVSMTELRNILFSAQDKDVKFLFIIVSHKVKDMYHKVKQMAERDVGILTQCIKETTAYRRINPQTVKNILLKVNSKLMGVNQVLDPRQLPNCLKSGDVMIVGADVTHPSPEQTSIPSIAAVTASMDSKCFSYNIELSIQAPKKEMIVEFADMMFDHLVVYREKNRTLPRKIYVFRDGVSEGQFAEVMNSELSAVHRAYQRLNPQQKPEVLFLLVQKRHHTRFFTVPNCANVEPGTVVDNHIVHPKELDFYLVSHQAIKGTARPTRYHAVCNDGNIPHDEVEQLTYYLCHLYSRCMRSVSYPTPTYYAHLACLRAKSLTHGQTFDNVALEKTPQRLRVLDKMLRFSRMFFV